MDKKNLIIGLALGAVAVGITSGIVGITKGDEIKEWFNETFKGEEKVKYLSVGDEITEDSVVKVNLVKLAEYIKDNEDDYTAFISKFKKSDSSSTQVLDLVVFENGNSLTLVSDYGQLSIKYNCSTDYATLFILSNNNDGIDLEVYDFLESLNELNIPMNIISSGIFEKTEITEVLGLTMDDDVVEEDLKIISIYEESAKEE